MKFYEDFAGNKIKPFFKSQPIPEKNDEPVKVVVADTWESIVLDTSKDVLVKFYAPWFLKNLLIQILNLLVFLINNFIHIL